MRSIMCTRGCTNCNICVCLSGRHVTGVCERFWEIECVCATLLFRHVLNLFHRDISIMVFTLASDLRGHVNMVVSKNVTSCSWFALYNYKQDSRALHGTSICIFFTKHLLWLTHAGEIPCVKTNDILIILSENWYLENVIEKMKDER